MSNDMAEVADRVGGRGADAVRDLCHVRGRRKARESDGLESLDLVAQRPRKPAVDVERAAAHPSDGAHVLDAGVRELAKDDRLAGPQGVLDDPAHLDGKRLGLRALEDRPYLPPLAGLDVRQGEDFALCGLGAQAAGGGCQEGKCQERAAHRKIPESVRSAWLWRVFKGGE